MKELKRQTTETKKYPERIIQFGEGNFLRAFADWIVWIMNEKAGFDSSVVVVQPIEKGMIDVISCSLTNNEKKEYREIAIFKLGVTL